MATLTLDIRTTDKQYLFGPFVDFLMLGGASLIILPLVVIFLPVDDFKPIVAAITLSLANVINHPHFANSYQIFYRNFRKKLSKAEYSVTLCARYFIAGIVVPLALIAFFSVAVIEADTVMLGRAFNLMAFLVGWHYVKQGYGMLMVDAVLKRNFFSTTEKKLLMANSYTCWLATWIYGNRVVESHNYFFLKYYTFDIPDFAFYVAALAAAITTTSVLVRLIARFVRDENGDFKGLPFNGVMAYLTSVYLWMMFVRANPLMILIVPAFHSLQYMLVVWRYQLNVESDKADGAARPETRPFGRYFRSLVSYRMTLFAVTGLALGYIAFWSAPRLLDDIVAYDGAVFGASLFLFMFWIFINVHHYFIDNVIWKSTNPEVGKYLFAAK